MATRLKNAGLLWQPLTSTTMSDSIAELASILAVTARSWPERPARFWDTDAVQRIELLVCESFAITERARNHLVRTVTQTRSGCSSISRSLPRAPMHGMS